MVNMLRQRIYVGMPEQKFDPKDRLQLWTISYFINNNPNVKATRKTQNDDETSKLYNIWIWISLDLNTTIWVINMKVECGSF